MDNQDVFRRPSNTIDDLLCLKLGDPRCSKDTVGLLTPTLLIPTSFGWKEETFEHRECHLDAEGRQDVMAGGWNTMDCSFRSTVTWVTEDPQTPSVDSDKNDFKKVRAALSQLGLLACSQPTRIIIMLVACRYKD
eukprot:GHVU01150543.1.p2 GENE.GHVU01150543.1~~GHVU01150543.1.p2  ORF type:complete len:135 (+),score=14.06 GHVU01150543.1:859-1263(+)